MRRTKTLRVFWLMKCGEILGKSRNGPKQRKKVSCTLVHFSKFLEFGTVKPHLTATSVIQSPRYYSHFFWPPGKNHSTFSCKKTLVNTATTLIRQNSFGPLMTILTGFHCSFLVLPTGAIP